MMITMRLILFLCLRMQKQSFKYLDCYAIYTEQGSDHAAHSLLDKCADLVHLRGATAIKQTTLLNYMN